MASADNPPAPDAATTGIQPANETFPAPIPLPPAPAAPPEEPPGAAESFARRCLVLDVLLVALVLVFAFLTASFSVQNGDFFRHLAVGRLLAQGAYTFGSDPFTWGSGDAYWVNHSWLFDLLVYALYQIPAAGGAAVVVFKALLVVALAEVLLRVSRRRGQSLWLPAACTGLAVLVISPRLVLQPWCISFLFLGLTLWLLRYPRLARERGTAPPTYRPFWLLPPLFLLWVNLDTWFVFGPAAVALYLAGEALGTRLRPAAEDADAPGPGELRSLAIALVAGLAACLVNPFGWHAFLPPEGLGLSASAEAVLKDSQFSYYLVGPTQRAYYEPGVGLTVAGMAYFPLLVLSLASFVLVPLLPGGWRALAGWRLFLWLPLLLLSLVNLRGIPFFAVVAGPVTALNLADVATQFVPAGGLPRPWRRWAVGGRLLTLLVALAAVVATVPGWLQAKQPLGPRRVAWDVQPDPSLRQMAEQIRAWREQGLVGPDTHWLNLSPEVPNYLAWFAPGERGLLDNRIDLFGAVAPDFIAVRQGLSREDAGPAEDPAEAGTRAPWRRILRKRGVRFVIVQESNRERGLKTLNHLMSNPAEWAPCYLDGRTTVFGWHEDPAGPDPFAGLRLDFRRLAFGPEAEKAPETGSREPELRPWWTELWESPPPHDLDGDAAIAHFNRFRALGRAFYDRNRHQWEALEGACLVGCAGGPGGPLLNGSAIPLGFAATYAAHPIGPGEPSQIPAGQLPAMDRLGYMLREIHSQTQDAGPPESLYLSVRAARRSLAVNPDEPRTYFWLGQAYNFLWRGTREHILAGDLIPVAAVRRTQVAAALNHALALRPNPLTAQQAHELLALMYLNIPPQKAEAELPYLELVAKHRRAQLQIMQEAGPVPGVSAKDYSRGLEILEKEVKALDSKVHRLENQYMVSAERKPLRDRYQIALDKGLVETALNAALGAPDPAELWDPARGLGGRPLAYGVLELLLDLGRLDDARQLLEPSEEKGDQATMVALLWYQVRRTAAAGDYAAADRYLAQVQAIGEGAAADLSALVAQALGQGLLGALMRPITVVPWQRSVLQANQTGLAYLQKQAELHLMRGWLALEAGDTDKAAEHLRAAEQMAPPPERWLAQLPDLKSITREQVVGGLLPLASRQAATLGLAARYREWLGAARR
jgi:hypothetical protein